VDARPRPGDRRRFTRSAGALDASLGRALKVETSFLTIGLTVLLAAALIVCAWALRQRLRAEQSLADRQADIARLVAERDRLSTELRRQEDLRSAAEAARDASEVARRQAAGLEAALRQGFDALPFPVWRRGTDSRIAWCNEAYGRMVELPASEAARRAVELAARIDPEQPRRLAEKALSAGAAQSERRHIVVSGDRRAYHFIEIPQADGTLVGFAADVSDLERTEHALAQHTSAHAEVLQNLNSALAIYGQDKRLILFNRAFADLWRLDPAWLAEQPSFAEILEQLRDGRRLPEQANWQLWKKSQLDLFTSVIEPKEELLHLPDERTLRVVVTPHPFGGLLFNYEDVSDRLGLERARNTLLAVQRATLDNLHEGVAVYGADGRLKLWNPALARILRLPAEFLENEPHISEAVEAIHSKSDAASREVFDGLIGAFSEREAHHGRAELVDGHVIDFATVPLPDGAMLFTYIDVTDSVRIERALRERNEALQAADQLKSEFIANVSYELRTPLNTIIGFTEILTNEYFGPLNDRQKEYTQGVLDSSHHLLLLVNDILDLATIEAGHMQLELDRFDLHQALVGILALTREHCLRRNLTVNFDCAPDIGWIEADERRIKQVLYNLMNNAIKFTPPNGSITLGARREDDTLRLWISDTGVGIPEEEQAQVFDKFVKGSNANRQPGAGLGLPLVRSFVEMHGGRVELSSQPEVGTTITCWLPALQRQSMVAAS